MRFLAPLFILLALVCAGCSSPFGGAANSNGGSKSYSDPTYHFSFRYPAAWGIKGKGHTELLPTPTYVLHINTHDQTVDLEVTVDHDIIALPRFQNGEVRKDPEGPDKLHYQHAQVSGYPAMHVGRYAGKTLDGLFVIFNTKKSSYQVRMISAVPPFKSSVIRGFNQIVRTLRVSGS